MARRAGVRGLEVRGLSERRPIKSERTLASRKSWVTRRFQAMGKLDSTAYSPTTRDVPLPMNGSKTESHGVAVRVAFESKL
jgi:hypothetical protein